MAAPSVAKAENKLMVRENDSFNGSLILLCEYKKRIKKKKIIDIEITQKHALIKNVRISVFINFCSVKLRLV
ncbi:hypothetical protein DZ985_01080 [Acinetobacter sp. JW]|nr:hypothetical protein DZ985_01080 [Acinetobacter sp. JW]